MRRGRLSCVASIVAVIDLETWQVTKKISTGTGPDGMAWIR